ncbi:MAG: hypothetical protein V3S10_06490 [Dehalococcoidales bacterium]
MTEQSQVAAEIGPELERAAIQKAKDRAASGRWDLNVAIFLFAVLMIVIILLFQDVVIEIVAPVAIFGLAMVWVVGWRRGKQLYQRFLEEEITAAKQGVNRTMVAIEETIEDRVQKALRNRMKR